MTILVDRASEAILGASPTLSAADQARIREDGWVAPAAIRQRQLAHALVNRFDEISGAERMAVLRLVEHFITDGTEAEHAAVATGFLEALLCAGDQGFDLDLVWSDLGPESQAYCRAWNDYCGVDNTR